MIFDLNIPDLYAGGGGNSHNLGHTDVGFKSMFRGSKAPTLVFVAAVTVVLRLFRDRVSLCHPGCPGTFYGRQAGLELPPSASYICAIGVHLHAWHKEFNLPVL